MHWIIIAMLALALLTGFGCGWVICDDTIKSKIIKMSASELVKWASKIRREGGLR